MPEIKIPASSPASGQRSALKYRPFFIGAGVGVTASVLLMAPILPNGSGRPRPALEAPDSSAPARPAVQDSLTPPSDVLAEPAPPRLSIAQAIGRAMGITAGTPPAAQTRDFGSAAVSGRQAVQPSLSGQFASAPASAGASGANFAARESVEMPRSSGAPMGHPEAVAAAGAKNFSSASPRAAGGHSSKPASGGQVREGLGGGLQSAGSPIAGGAAAGESLHAPIAADRAPAAEAPSPGSEFFAPRSAKSVGRRQTTVAAANDGSEAPALTAVAPSHPSTGSVPAVNPGQNPATPAPAVPVSPNHDAGMVVLDALHSFAVPSTKDMQLTQADYLDAVPQPLPSAPWHRVVHLGSDNAVASVGFMTRGEPGAATGNGHASIQVSEAPVLGDNSGCAYYIWISASPGGLPYGGGLAAFAGNEDGNIFFTVSTRGGNLQPETVYWFNIISHSYPASQPHPADCAAIVVSPLGQTGDGCIPPGGSALQYHQMGLLRTSYQGVSDGAGGQTTTATPPSPVAPDAGCPPLGGS